jgi:hypothetical protein
MTAFIELVAVELAVTLSVGAVLGFVSWLLSTPERSKRRNRPQGCRHCGSVGADGSRPDQGRANKGHQSQ